MGTTTHECLGCDGLIILYHDGLIIDGIMHQPPGAVGHSKPKEDANRRSVQCKLYQRLTAQELTRLHRKTPTTDNPVKTEAVAPPTYSIARALSSFSDEDETIVCAYMEAMESAKKRGDLQAWSLVHGPDKNWRLVIFTIGGETFQGTGETIDEARKELSRSMIETAMHGASST